MRDFPLIIVALLVVCQVSAEEQVEDGAFADGVDTTICYDGRNLVGFILSPDYYGSSDATYQISQTSSIVFCNLPDIFWLHLDYIEKTPPSSRCMSDIQLPYIIQDANGGVISTATGSCSMAIYQWNTLLYNPANVAVLLPAAGGKALFRVQYRVVSCAIPNVKTTQVGLTITTFKVTGCDDGYTLVGGTSGIFTCNSTDGRWESESAVPKCIDKSLTSSSASASTSTLSSASTSISVSTLLSASPSTSSNTTPSLSSSTTSSKSSILLQSSSSPTPPNLSPTSPSSDSAQTTPNSVPSITTIAVAVSVSGLLLLCIVIGILIYIIRRQSHHRKEQIEESNASAEGGSAGGPIPQSNRWYVADDAYDTISLHSGTNSPSAGTSHDAAMPGNGNVSPDGQVHSVQAGETSEQPDEDTYTNSAQLKDREHEGRSNYSSILAANKSWRRPSDTIEMVESDIYGT